MSTDKSAEAIGKIEGKVDTLLKEIEGIKKSLSVLQKLPLIAEQVEGIDSGVKEVQDFADSIVQIEEIGESVKGLGEALESASTSEEITAIDQKLDDISNEIAAAQSVLTEIQESKEFEVLFKKLDDVLILSHEIDTKVSETSKASDLNDIEEKIDGAIDSIGKIESTLETLQGETQGDVISKKIDDLQQYVAGLSALEEKVDDLVSSFNETKEIVGIIVRQLDDIERKYNKAIEDISETMELMKQALDNGSVTVPSDDGGQRESHAGKKPKETVDPAVLAKLPQTIDELMDKLLVIVKPQTEARDMARALEEVRDRLTLLIQDQTPVLYQVGTRARELKTYPPTATLNENDIARLNKEIRDWRTKLKKLATG
jgi:uncharacterized protein YoxC